MAAAPHVLVAYATASGSTAGIAERIADVLRAGCDVLLPARRRGSRTRRFDALVLGSAVHDMAWLSPAVDLIRRAADSGPPPLWCFSVGGLNPRGRLAARWRPAKPGVSSGSSPPASSFAAIGCSAASWFAERGCRSWGRVFYRLTGGRPGDHRDWPAINAWATGIATQLPAHGPRARSSQAAGADVIRDRGPAGRGQQSLLPVPSGSTRTLSRMMSRDREEYR